MRLFQIALKSLLKKNLCNISLLLCTALLILLPSLLYNVSGSVVSQVESSQKDVFGAFNDIVYAPQISTDSIDKIDEEIELFLNGYNTSLQGIISAVYSDEINESRELIAGYADESAMVLDIVLSALVVSLVLILSRKRIQKRTSTYYRLGLSEKEIYRIIGCERIIAFILGISAGLLISAGMSHFVLWKVADYAEQSFIYKFDYVHLIPFIIAFFIVLSVTATLFTVYDIDRSIETVKSERMDKKKRIKFSKRFSLIGFSLKRNTGVFSTLIVLVICSVTLMSYGVFYGNLFKSDALEAPPGTLPRDYDFQYVARPVSAAPWQDKNDPIMFFTDTLEKIGATDSFLTELKTDPMTGSVKAYRENNKFFTMLEPSQLDDYIDGSDYKLDGVYGSNYGFFNDFGVVADKFRFADDDLLIESQVIGYPDDVLMSLADSVAAGEINIDKIRSGEEVILRVPAYILNAYEDGGVAHTPVDYSSPGAINLESLKVGDEVTLTSLWTDEMVNGAVPKSFLEKFERKDITVKIGAIIRSTDGILYHSSQEPFAYLTVNEAFDILDIPGSYSIVSVYTKAGFTDNELINRFAQYSANVPNMTFQNFISDTKTYRIYNLLITVYVSTLIGILMFTALAVLISGLANLTQFSLKTYALLRISGLKFAKIIRLQILQSALIILLGSLFGVPISIAVIMIFGVETKFDVFEEFLYYFPLENYLYILTFMIIIGVIALIPSLIILCRSRNNVLDGIDSE